MKKSVKLFGAGSIAVMFMSLAASMNLVSAQSSSSDDAAFASGMGTLVTCCCLGISLLFTILMVSYVYNDANKRGNNNAVLWALITFFFGIFGLLLYLLVGRN